MVWLASLQFVTPLALWGLLALPVIWWLIRSIPPRPKTQAFPPLRILMQLGQTEQSPLRMPWWLLLLRLALAAFLILAVAHPFSRATHRLQATTGPLLLVLDDGWAAAGDWQQRRDSALDVLQEVGDRPTYVAETSLAQIPVAKSATEAAQTLRATTTQALPTSRMKLLPLLESLSSAPSEIIWLADGLDAGSASSFASGLARIAPTKAFTMPGQAGPLALGRPAIKDGALVVPVLRNASSPTTATVQALGGNSHILGEQKVEMGSATEKQASLSLPVELRNKIESLVIKGQQQAGAKKLLDDTWRRKTVAIMTSDAASVDQPLLTSTHYLNTAIAPVAEISTPQNSNDLQALLDGGLSMLVLADSGSLPQPDHDAVAAWVSKGGMLVRFAGPKLAAKADDLLPVTLRDGDRNLGSSLSWETPQHVRPVSDNGPLAGLSMDHEIIVSRQLLAEPDADLSTKTWASLEDGTPLITAAAHGNGRIVLFHVTANADWSNLPLTGTFNALLRRLVELAPAAGEPATTNIASNAQGDFAPRLVMQGTGELASPPREIKGIAPSKIAAALATQETPAGLYTRGSETRAINLNLSTTDLTPMPDIAGAAVLTPGETHAYAPLLFVLATILFLLDTLAALFIGGHLRRAATAVALLMALGVHHPSPAIAADDAAAMQSALQTHLAFVKTGDAETDQTSEAGLKGLDNVIADRTSAVLGDPTAIDIENDELVFYPLLYWPVLPDAEAPNPKAIGRIAEYMKSGGTIFFDLREQSGALSGTPAGEALRRILSGLDISPLQPVPDDHALTKSFYLLKDFPGRYEGAPVWVETQDDPQASGFDNVSGIIIGANDYAAAWAMNDHGQPLNALIPDSPQQREMALRFGINLVMYVLTGNYKTDQVHIPAILERLGKK